jgi:WD40 repeat protein
MSKPSHSLALLAFCGFIAFAAAAPVPTSKPTPKPKKAISPATLAGLKKLKELPRNVWEIVLGPKRGEVSFVTWERPVEVLDGETFRPLRTIGAKMRIIHFAASPDGKKLALGTNSTRIELRDLASKKTVVLETQNAQSAPVFSPDSKFVATGGYGTEAKLWDAKTGKLVRTFAAGREGGLTIAFSPNGKLLAVGNRNGQTRLYETATGQLLHTLPKRWSHELKFSPNGRVLAVAYVKGQVALWDVAKGVLLHEKETGAREVYTLDWSPAGDVLATAGLHGKIILWDPRSLKVLKELDAPEWLIRVRFSPDGARLLTAGGAEGQGGERKFTIWGLDP